jgi:hypothetical protein
VNATGVAILHETVESRETRVALTHTVGAFTLLVTISGASQDGAVLSTVHEVTLAQTISAAGSVSGALVRACRDAAVLAHETRVAAADVLVAGSLEGTVTGAPLRLRTRVSSVSGVA